MNKEEALRVSLEEARKTGQLTASTRNLLSEAFGTRYRNAIALIGAGKVRRVTFNQSKRTVWLVSGKGREYLILPKAGFCSCEDFYFRVISQEETLCYHLLAQKLADALGQYSAAEEEDERYDEVVNQSVTQVEHARRSSIRDAEAIRLFVAQILAGAELPLKSIAEALADAGFPPLTNRHLAAILAADKTRRFFSKRGVWSLRSHKAS